MALELSHHLLLADLAADAGAILHFLSRLRYGSVKVCIRMEFSLVCQSPTAMRAASRLRMTLMEVNLN